MGFIKKTTVIAFQILFISNLIAQNSGYRIRNYTTKEYKGFTQMWYCVQDNRGVLYFGNSSNVLEYDGKNWRAIPISKGVAIRTLHIDDKGIIYVGAVGDFGYLKSNEKGELKFESLTNLLNTEQKKFSDIWEIHEIDDAIVFQTSENLYVYKNNKISVIPPPNNSSFASVSFKVGNKIYVRERKNGLMSFDGKEVTLISKGEVFADEPLIGLVNYGKNESGKMLAISVDNGFFIIDEKKSEIKKLSPSSEKIILEKGPLGVKWFNDSTLVMNTRAGVYFLNTKLEIVRTITKSDGLNEESISNIFFDNQNEMWLCSNNGISKVSVNSPLYYYNQSSGFSGNIESIYIFNDNIYIGTTSGIYTSNLNNNNNSGQPQPLKFKAIEGTYFEVWNFNIHKNKIYAATSDGVFEIENEKLKRLTKAYSNFIHNSTISPDIMYVGEKDGLRILENKSGKWETVKFIDLTTLDIMNIIEVPGKDTREVWASTRKNGVLKIIFNNDLSYIIKQYDSSKGIPNESVYLAQYDNSIYFIHSADTYVYDKELDDEQKKCFYIKNDFFVTFNHNGIILDLLNPSIPIGKKTLKALHSIEENGYSYFQNNQYILWVGLTDILVRYDSKVNKDYEPAYNCLIRKVTLKNDSLLFGGYTSSTNKKNIIEYTFNSISFEYASPFFEREDANVFSYQLIGFENDWSPWSNDNTKQYTNLTEGEYTFKVKAKNIYNHESSIAEYQFIILPPWYRTTWAFVMYFVIFILIIFVTVRVSIHQLRVAKIKLERIVTERTTEVVKQKEELIEKNTIIEVAYNDIKSSINYAKRIQEAILPIKDEIKDSFPNSFIFFKPRDVVSGDFYWFTNHNNCFIIACVDCTGHGVPGAFMSMIGNTLLNEIVIEKNITKPSEILNLLHERVRQSLKQDMENSETRDGMDVSICVINNNKMELQYAGANRSLLFIRDSKLQEIKPNKQPIGGDQMDEDRIFTNHSIDLRENDSIYMTTDGFADQFGGEKGKKYMVKRFHQTLIEIQEISMEAQDKKLETIISNWQGSLEQVDDILVIGIKF